MQPNDVVDHLKAELIKLGEKSDDFHGCTEEQINEIMRLQGASKLPGLYHDFLLRMGRGAGSLFVGSGIYYGAMKWFNFKEEALDYIQSNNLQFQLPENAFIFLWHQAYLFMYFDSETEDYDPQVYLYLEGETHPRENKRLSNLFLRELKLHQSVANGTMLIDR